MTSLLKIKALPPLCPWGDGTVERDQSPQIPETRGERSLAILSHSQNREKESKKARTLKETQVCMPDSER